MLIRKQDKMIIQQVALLGAILSALASGYFIWELPVQAKASYAQQDEMLRQAGAIHKLTTAMSEQSKLVKSVTEGIGALDVHNEVSTETSFWAEMPKWKMIGLSVAGAAGAGALVYGLIWATMLLASIALYIFIRKTYQVVRVIMPDCEAAIQKNMFIDGKETYQRNPDRLLPLAIKLMFLLSLTLILLGIIVWQITSIQK